MAVVLIRACGKVSIETIQRHGDSQRLVGGDMSREVLLEWPDLRLGVLTNKFAKAIELPINMPATTWLASHGHNQLVRGDVLVVGVDDERRECSCHQAEDVVDTIPDMWDDDEACIVALPATFLEEVHTYLSTKSEDEKPNKGGRG